MHSVRLMLIGGFLGAGKTTTLGRLAAFFQAQGKRVGLVTNDQANDLVDTHLLRSQGFPVAEVPGACFCCRFDELVAKFGSLDAEQQPDIILAEPVGSCTDLVATVIQPLKDLYRDRFSVAPFAVLFKPAHGFKILRQESSGFSPKAAYIFKKQLEEADLIVINRADELTAEQLSELIERLNGEYPGRPILPVSAKTGFGFEQFAETLQQQNSNFGKRILDIDYDTYAEGEAEMGWLNLSAKLSASAPFLVDDLLISILEALRSDFVNIQAEIGHLKLIAMIDGGYAVANLVSSDSPSVLSIASNQKVNEVEMIVNARVSVEPDQLAAMVQQQLKLACERIDASWQIQQLQSLKPGRPMPTHRYANQKA